MSKSKPKTYLASVRGNPNYSLKTYDELFDKLFSKDFWKKFPLCAKDKNMIISNIANGEYQTIPLGEKALTLLRSLNEKALKKGLSPVVSLSSVNQVPNHYSSSNPWLIRLVCSYRSWMEVNVVRLSILTNGGLLNIGSLAENSDKLDCLTEVTFETLVDSVSFVNKVLYHDQLVALLKKYKDVDLYEDYFTDLDDEEGVTLVINDDGISDLHDYESRSEFEGREVYA